MSRGRGQLHAQGKTFTHQRALDPVRHRNGRQYETSVVDFTTPCVWSKKTGKLYTLPWADIVDMAINAGIDEA